MVFSLLDHRKKMKSRLYKERKVAILLDVIDIAPLLNHHLTHQPSTCHTQQHFAETIRYLVRGIITIPL